MTAILDWIARDWPWFFILMVLGVFEDVRDFIVDTLRMLTEAASREKMRELELQGRQLASHAQQLLPEAYPHARCHVVPVISSDKVVAFLCKDHDVQLASDWGIRQEDLEKLQGREMDD
jgi:hypothetical protein